MSDEKKTAEANSQTTKMRQEVTEPSGRTRSFQAEFPSTPLGNLTKVYTTVGIVGFAVIGSMAAFFLILKSSLDAQHAQVLYMQQTVEANNKRIDRIWDEAAKERQSITDRYIAGREVTEKRHQEMLAMLNKIVLYVEMSMQWVKDRQERKGLEPPPPPKAPKMDYPK